VIECGRLYAYKLAKTIFSNVRGGNQPARVFRIIIGFCSIYVSFIPISTRSYVMMYNASAIISPWNYTIRLCVYRKRYSIIYIYHLDFPMILKYIYIYTPIYKLYNNIHKRYIPTRVYMKIRENFSSRNTQEYWTRVKPAWTERILLRHRTKAHTHPHIIYI